MKVFDITLSAVEPTLKSGEKTSNIYLFNLKLYSSDMLYTNEPALRANSVYQTRRTDSRQREPNVYRLSHTIYNL